MTQVARFSLLPHDQTFFDLFVEAGKNSVHAAHLLDQLMREWPDSGNLHEQIVELVEKVAGEREEWLKAASA